MVLCSNNIRWENRLERQIRESNRGQDLNTEPSEFLGLWILRCLAKRVGVEGNVSEQGQLVRDSRKWRHDDEPREKAQVGRPPGLWRVAQSCSSVRSIWYLNVAQFNQLCGQHTTKGGCHQPSLPLSPLHTVAQLPYSHSQTVTLGMKVLHSRNMS